MAKTSLLMMHNIQDWHHVKCKSCTSGHRNTGSYTSFVSNSPLSCTATCSLTTGSILIDMGKSPWLDLHMLWNKSHSVCAGQQWM